MVRGTSYMFVTWPNVVKTVTHEDVDMEGLGGADVHATRSGVAHFAFDSEPECLAAVRELFDFIPQNNVELPPRHKSVGPHDRQDEGLLAIVPDHTEQTIRHARGDPPGGGRRTLLRGARSVRR